MSAPEQNYDVIVLGGGAAGLMCAAVAGQRGCRVLLVERAEKIGKKILISGGGRCNFTNIHTSPECFLSANPHFPRSALSRYTPADFIALVERYGIAWHEKTLGQLFCDGSARQIVDLLAQECASGAVEIRVGQQVRAIDHGDGRFGVDLGQHAAAAPALVLATGGPSIPKMGATGFAYEVAEQFGLAVETPRPALVPLTLAPDDQAWTALTGVASNAVVTCNDVSFREAFLFTHRGLSGPAILQISSYWAAGDAIAINMLPDLDNGWLATVKRERPRATVRGALAERLPTRLAQKLGERLGDKLDVAAALATLPDRALHEVGADLAAWPFRPNGTEGFAKAEVTAGGISTRELSSRTMQAKSVSGLFAVGEAVDVTGWLGGYNFQWAWASGQAAGEALGEMFAGAGG